MSHSEGISQEERQTCHTAARQDWVTTTAHAKQNDLGRDGFSPITHHSLTHPRTHLFINQAATSVEVAMDDGSEANQNVALTLAKLRPGRHTYVHSHRIKMSSLLEKIHIVFPSHTTDPLEFHVSTSMVEPTWKLWLPLFCWTKARIVLSYPEEHK